MRFAFADLRLSGRVLATALLAVVVGASAPADARLGRSTSAQIDAPIDAVERASIGARLAYVREQAGREQRRVYVASTDGREERAIETGSGDGYPAAATADGGLFVLRAEDEGERHVESLVLVEPSGERKVVATGTRIRNPSVASDGAIAFESDASSFRDLFVARRGEATRLTDNPEGNYEPAFSSDGRSLVFTSSRDFDAEIYAMAADGESPRRLTTSPGDDMRPLPSPDGRRIAFISGRTGEDRIFVMGAGGEGQRPVRVAHATESEREHVWSPDGRHLAFVARPRDGKSRILIWDAVRDSVAQLTDGASVCDMPAFSPDGRYIAFVSDRTGTPDIWLMRRDGTGAVRVFDRQPAGPKRWLPTWVPGRPRDQPRARD